MNIQKLKSNIDNDQIRNSFENQIDKTISYIESIITENEKEFHK
jgi:hypothetical protein